MTHHHCSPCLAARTAGSLRAHLENHQPKRPVPPVRETSPLLRETAAAAIPPFPATTPHPGIRPAPAPYPAPRCLRASLADRPARQIPAHAPRAATRLLRESVRTPIPAPRAPSPAQAHSQLAVPARTWSSAAAIRVACRTPIHLAPFVTWLCLLPFRGQMTCHVTRRRRHVHQPTVCLVPGRGVSHFYFPHAIQNRLPKISEHRERFRGHHRLVQHLPHNRKLHERSRPAFACYKSIRAPDQLKESFFPGLHTHFHVNPRIELGGLEKFRGHPGCFPAGFLGSAGHRFHHPAVTAATNRETVLRQSSPQDPRLFVIRVSLARPRTPKYGDDKFFAHLQSSTSLRVLVLQSALRRRHIEFLQHRHT